MINESRIKKLERLETIVSLAGGILGVGGFVISGVGIYTPNTDLIYVGSKSMFGGAISFAAASLMVGYKLKLITNKK